jgi:hypothetical protein
MASITSALLFIGGSPQGLRYVSTWDASTGSFPGAGLAQGGDLYKVSVAGTVDGESFDVGDSLIASTINASTTTFVGNWTKVDATESVNTVFTRTGNIVAAEGDYDLDQLGDVDLTTVAPTIGQTLVWNGTDWVPGAASGGASNLDDLTDVDTTTLVPAVGNTLVFDGVNWVPTAVSGTNGYKGVAATFAAARAIPGLVAGDYVWITADGDPDVLPAQRRGAFRKMFGASPALSTSWSGPYGWVANSPQMFASDQMYSSTQMYATA